MLDYLDVDMGCKRGTAKWGGASPETGDVPPAARSLLILSCLMNPVAAQPNRDAYEIRWSWVLLCGWLCGTFGVLLGFFLAGWREEWKNRRLQRLRLEGDKLESSAETAISQSHPEMEEVSKHWKVPPPCLPAKFPTVKPPPPTLTYGGAVVIRPKPPPPKSAYGEDVATKPKMPVKRPPPFMRQETVLPSIRTLSKTSTPSGKSSVTEVSTPPRQSSSELPPLLSYEELIARSLRRELQREPSAAEVSREIYLMRLRHEVREGDSEGSSLRSSDTEWSDDSSRGSEVRDPHASSSNQPPSLDNRYGMEQSSGGSSGADNEGTGGASSQGSGFQYLAPTATPIVRIRGSWEDDLGNTVYDAVRVYEGTEEPVDLYSRPSSAVYVDEAPQVVGNQRMGIGEGALLEAVREEGSSVGSSETSEPEESSASEGPTDLDIQLAEATLLLQQNTELQIPAELNHLSSVQRSAYYRLLARQRQEMEEVD